jgi:AcrR family transcriptional regulator
MVSHLTPAQWSPGRQGLPKEFLDEVKRERTAFGLAEVACEFGLRNVTITMIVTQAKMARNTFYELFANRDAAVRYAAELGNRKLTEAIDQAAEHDGPWAQRIEAIISQLLTSAETAPDLIELCLVHAQGAQGIPIPFDPDLVQTLAGVMRPGRDDAAKDKPGPRTEELLAHAVLSVIAAHLRKGETETLPGLQGELTELVTRPFLTPKVSVKS